MRLDKSSKNGGMSYFIHNRSKKKRKKKVRGK
jgi:hypothetical protein